MTNSTIVHIGFGAFHRAHQLVYAQKLRDQDAFPWNCCEVSLFNTGDIEVLRQQQNQFCVLEQSVDGQQCRPIKIVTESLHPLLDGYDSVRQRISEPDVKIVSLTITERAYGLDANGAFNSRYEGFTKDMAGDSDATTAFGLLADAIALRAQNNVAGLTVLSCDNLCGNGDALKQAVCHMMDARQPHYLSWLHNNVCFPNTMVDRIVPKMTETSRQLLNTHTNFDDQCGVVSEAYSQWVIEDSFANDRPQWENAGVVFVDDVTPFETMKLRMLNGAHSLVAYIGQLLGSEYVADFMSRPNLSTLVKHFMLNEQALGLTMHLGDIQNYADALATRFQNPHLHHRTAQIAMDGSQKLVQRITPVICENRMHQRQHEVGVFVLSAWLVYIVTSEGEVVDPMSELFRSICQSSCTPERAVHTLVWHDKIFPKEVRNDFALLGEIYLTAEAILRRGIEEELETLVSRVCP